MIYVDWSADSRQDYGRARKEVNDVGRKLAGALGVALKYTTPEKIHIIGAGIGGHVSELLNLFILF